MANLCHGMSKPPPTMMAEISIPPPPRNVVIAVYNGGFPVPNFLQPLASRESQPLTTCEDVDPSMPSYINGKATTQTNNVCRRSCLGRDGQIVIYSVPCPFPLCPTSPAIIVCCKAIEHLHYQR